jgi:hypothetical protein
MAENRGFGFFDNEIIWIIIIIIVIFFLFGCGGFNCGFRE